MYPLLHTHCFQAAPQGLTDLGRQADGWHLYPTHPEYPVRGLQPKSSLPCRRRRKCAWTPPLSVRCCCDACACLSHLKERHAVVAAPLLVLGIAARPRWIDAKRSAGNNNWTGRESFAVRVLHVTHGTARAVARVACVCGPGDSIADPSSWRQRPSLECSRFAGEYTLSLATASTWVQNRCCTGGFKLPGCTGRLCEHGTYAIVAFTMMNMRVQ